MDNNNFCKTVVVGVLISLTHLPVTRIQSVHSLSHSPSWLPSLTHPRARALTHSLTMTLQSIHCDGASLPSCVSSLSSACALAVASLCFTRTRLLWQHLLLGQHHQQETQCSPSQNPSLLSQIPLLPTLPSTSNSGSFFPYFLV